VTDLTERTWLLSEPMQKSIFDESISSFARFESELLPTSPLSSSQKSLPAIKEKHYSSPLAHSFGGTFFSRSGSLKNIEPRPSNKPSLLNCRVSEQALTIN